jgi:hypothetical protein
MNKDLKDGLIIIGIVVLGVIILLPRKKGITAPQEAESSKVKQKENARIILDAYLDAIDAKESASNLDKLNSMFVEEYKMKVVRTKDGKFVARTLSGEDVLMVK